MFFRILFAFVYCGLVMSASMSALAFFFVFLDYLAGEPFNYLIIVKTFKISFFIGLLMPLVYIIERGKIRLPYRNRFK